ncbi:hypothetical protein Rhe02_16030 [Rhizocola hellebori]|uniref:Luciferase domain-containing protein n=1 Tax=Rhizocola hellebori TaxID=1392758 RepID=A0A8J3VEQ6_9ACTN|nr:luciferase family protein [Rhizocola hellebori]GIH03536.1 hypothetical protein Rhe02_16030 [Rhizocola hellebori]
MVRSSEWIRELILSTGEVAEAPSRYKDDLGYWLDGREIAHFENHDVLDLRLTRSVIRENRDTLKADPRVQLRGSSDWVTVQARQEDEQFVAQLIRQAIDANRNRSAAT